MASAKKRVNMSAVSEELYLSYSEEELENSSSSEDSFDSSDEEDNSSCDTPPPRSTSQTPTTTQKPSQTKVLHSTPAKRLKTHCFSPSRVKKRACSPRATSEQGQWHNTDKDDVTPVPHPFAPVRTPGVQLDGHQEYKPLQLFQLFMARSSIKTLCQNTNKYAEHRKERGVKIQWRPVTELEMYKFLSLVIYSSLAKTSTVRDMWRQDRLHKFPFPPSVMVGIRFEAIFRNLYMSDFKKDMKNEELKGTSGYDRLIHLKPLMNDIQIACKTYYQPDQNLSIDERMVATKSRIGIKQYMKNKPKRGWGFKLFVLADSKNGYTLAFNIYQGKSEACSGKGVSYDAVMDLLSTASVGTGYHIYVDNFYTSCSLFSDLHSKRFGACGTIRENRIGFPKTKVNALSKKASRGDIRWIREGPLLFVKWMDTREVTICSTIHSAYSGGTVQRRVRKEDGSWSFQSIPVPEPVRAYNRYMGGVDLSDALIKYFTVSHKTMKWYKKLFLHFVDIAVVNSYILHQELSRAKQEKPLTQKKFREALCLQLADMESVRPRASAATDPGEEEEEEVSQSAEDAGKKRCYPVTIVDTSLNDKRNKATVGRRHCVLCLKKKIKSKTIFKCRSCDVALCINAARLCFTKYHDEQ